MSTGRPFADAEAATGCGVAVPSDSFMSLSVDPSARETRAPVSPGCSACPVSCSVHAARSAAASCATAPTRER